jgi:hypothetical protein
VLVGDRFDRFDDEEENPIMIFDDDSPTSPLRMKTEHKYSKLTASVFYIIIPFSNMKNCQFQLVS